MGRAPELCVSLAAGFRCAICVSGLARAKWARAMPSPVCRMARGLTPLCFRRDVAKSDRIRARKLFDRVGPVLDLPEEQFDAITATPLVLPMDITRWRRWRRPRRDAGLDRKTALTAAAHALADGIGVLAGQAGAELDELLRRSGDTRRNCRCDDGGDGSRRLWTRGRARDCGGSEAGPSERESII